MAQSPLPAAVSGAWDAICRRSERATEFWGSHAIERTARQYRGHSGVGQHAEGEAGGRSGVRRAASKRHGSCRDTDRNRCIRRRTNCFTGQ